MKYLMALVLALCVAGVSEAGNHGRSSFRFRSNFNSRGHHAGQLNFVAPVIVPAPIYAQPQAFIGGYSAPFVGGGCHNGAGVLQFNAGGCSALFRAGY